MNGPARHPDRGSGCGTPTTVPAWSRSFGAPVGRCPATLTSEIRCPRPVLVGRVRPPARPTGCCERDAASREVSLAGLQVWQALTERVSGKPANREVTLVFTDLVGFSSWALKAGDDATLKLLRRVAQVVEPPLLEAGGHIVKRMGDGTMAVFADPATAVRAVRASIDAVKDVEVEGYTPRMRAGVHTGRPQRIGSDWLGVDVNIAARVMERATRGGLIVSQATMDRIPAEDFDALGLSAKRIRKQVFSHEAGRCSRRSRHVPGENSQGVASRRRGERRHRRRIVVGEMLLGICAGLARIRVTVAYAAILTGVTTALVTARAAGAGAGDQPRQHQPAQPQPRPHRHAVRQRVRHRRRADLRVAARLDVPAGPRRAALAQRSPADRLRGRPHRRHAAGRGRPDRRGRARLAARRTSPARPTSG